MDTDSQKSSAKNKRSDNDKAAASSIPAAAHIEQNTDKFAQKHAEGSMQGNLSIPLDNDETIGVP